MRMQPAIQYDHALFAVSIAIAIVASGVALWIARTLADASQNNVLSKRAAAALVMGIAITGMHYTGNAAANFLPGSVCGAANDIDSRWLATTVVLFKLAILSITLVLSRFDARTSMLAGNVSRLNGQIVRMASFDTLTDLPNRRTMTERIERAISSANTSDSRFAILFMDLDGFKTINDSLGHTVGDEVLKAFAKRLLQCVRGGDTVARLGGEEFVVMLENLTVPTDAEKMAERILEVMRKGIVAAGHPLQVMPSIGISLYPQDGVAVDTLLKHADVAMYEAKRGGRSTYRFFEASMNEAAARTLQIQQALHDALASNYFSAIPAEVSRQERRTGGRGSADPARSSADRHAHADGIHSDFRAFGADRADRLLGRARDLQAHFPLAGGRSAAGEGRGQPVAAPDDGNRSRREHA